MKDLSIRGFQYLVFGGGKGAIPNLQGCCEMIVLSICA